MWIQEPNSRPKVQISASQGDLRRASDFLKFRDSAKQSKAVRAFAARANDWTVCFVLVAEGTRNFKGQSPVENRGAEF